MTETIAAIRPFQEQDWPGLWAMIEPVFRAGETFPQEPAISVEAAHQAWVGSAAATFVAVDAEGSLLGTYYLKPNQPALGAHVANAGYIVAKASRRQGVASALCEHSQREAIRRGFRALQFNLVVSTNTAGIRTWRKNGFATIGTLPGAFHHPRLGDVDALVMFKSLVQETG